MDWLIRSLGKKSDAIGFVPSLLCAIAWVVGGAILVREGVGVLEPYPWVAQVFLGVVSIVVALGGVICFWILDPHIEYRRRGYRARRVAGNEWVYEERRADGSVECLPFLREFIGEGYPAPCEVRIASEGTWDRQVPAWAQGRRAEILGRIAEMFGADERGGRVEFKDAD